MIDDSDAEVRATLIPMWERTLWDQALWEQGLPAMKTPRSLEDRSAWIASKLCSHKVRSHRDFLLPGTHCGCLVYSGLADSHQAGVTPRGRGVDAQGSLDHQALQRHAGFALGQAMDPDDGAGALGYLLANTAQLV